MVERRKMFHVCETNSNYFSMISRMLEVRVLSSQLAAWRKGRRGNYKMAVICVTLTAFFILRGFLFAGSNPAAAFVTHTAIFG